MQEEKKQECKKCEATLISKAEKSRETCDWCKLKKSRIGGRVND